MGNHIRRPDEPADVLLCDVGLDGIGRKNNLAKMAQSVTKGLGGGKAEIVEESNNIDVKIESKENDGKTPRQNYLKTSLTRFKTDKWKLMRTVTS